MDYYEYSDFPFNFLLVTDPPRDRPVSASDMEAIIKKWLDNMPTGKTANWVVKK
jgi:hypothetical protein